MEQSKISFESLPELVNSLVSEIEGLKTLVKEALGKKTSEPDNRLVGIDEACKILRRKKSTIYHMVRDGILPHYKVGKMLEFRPSELIAWQEQHASEGTKSTDEILNEMKSGMRRQPKSGW
ncbi:MAG: helix-turn-helix domain-containing protein [Duncaniella sp.]|nr:helix-turn-helix domain-containing protein [Duncaniella sp.]